MNKLAIGTAQFGMKYGIANKDSQLNPLEAKKIIRLAKDSKIDLIDTAISYGYSEKILGEIGIKNFKIVSKLPSIPRNCPDVNLWIEEKIQSSLKRLRIKSLYGLLLHHPEDLLGNFGKKIINALNLMKQKGLVKKIGISIYDPLKCIKIMKLTRIEIVQSPLNIIDQRLVTSGLLSKLHSEEIEVHVRSIFLQGLLLMPFKKIPKHFRKWSKIFNQWSLILKKKNLSAVEACLLFSLSFEKIDKVIVGVNNVNQFCEIIKKSKVQKPHIDWSLMISNDQKLINPTKWDIS